jgi:hypothetical protein
VKDFSFRKLSFSTFVPFSFSTFLPFGIFTFDVIWGNPNVIHLSIQVAILFHINWMKKTDNVNTVLFVVSKETVFLFVFSRISNEYENKIRLQMFLFRSSVRLITFISNTRQFVIRFLHVILQEKCLDD